MIHKLFQDFTLKDFLLLCFGSKSNNIYEKFFKKTSNC